MDGAYVYPGGIKSMKRLTVVLSGLVLACSVSFAHALNSTVNVNVSTQTLSLDAFTEVMLIGAGGGTVHFFDLATAPRTGADAIALALAQLGLPATQPLSGVTVTPNGTASIFDEDVSSNYNPIDDHTFVLGDPDDYATWIAIGPEDVNVDVLQTTSTYSLFSVAAGLGETTTPVPLPASGLLLLAALGGTGFVLRRRRD